MIDCMKGDAAHTVAGTTAARWDLGFTPAVRPAEGLRRASEWLRGMLEAPPKTVIAPPIMPSPVVV